MDLAVGPLYLHTCRPTSHLLLNSVLSLMAMHKETNNTKEEPNNPHHKEIRDHRKKRNMQKFIKVKPNDSYEIFKVQTTTKNY